MAKWEWSFNQIKEHLEKSDLWVARMIYRMAKDFASIDVSAMDTQLAATDAMFFSSLYEYFESNGHFTDRHIFLARRKVRDPYIQYLVLVANS